MALQIFPLTDPRYALAIDFATDAEPQTLTMSIRLAQQIEHRMINSERKIEFSSALAVPIDRQALCEVSQWMLVWFSNPEHHPTNIANMREWDSYVARVRTKIDDLHTGWSLGWHSRDGQALLDAIDEAPLEPL